MILLQLSFIYTFLFIIYCIFGIFSHIYFAWCLFNFYISRFFGALRGFVGFFGGGLVDALFAGFYSGFFARVRVRALYIIVRVQSIIVIAKERLRLRQSLALSLKSYRLPRSTSFRSQ